MSGHDRKDFDERLAELNNWQIEQQKKLKAFQEAQKKLLDLEHQNVLNSLNTQNFGQRNNRCNEGISNSEFKENEPAACLDLQNFRAKESNGIFQLKFPQIKLTEPKASLFNLHNQAKRADNFFGDSMESFEESNIRRPRKFLRRGEGLARFRMTLDDFKGPPKIYRDKRIKTYLNNKPEPKRGNQSIKTVKNKCNRNPTNKVPVKSAPVPVKIYMPENKTKQCNSARSCESKQTSQTSRKSGQFLPKTPIENLALKPHSIATEWYNAMKEKERAESKNEKPEHKNNPVFESDVENRKDEKELRIFEILEKKVDDTSFCSTSSFVDKLMEQSLSSTPAKSLTTSKNLCNSYAQGLKSLRSQFLEGEQIKRLEELDKIPFEKEIFEPGSDDEDVDKERLTPEVINNEGTEEKDINEELEMIQNPDEEPEILDELPVEVDPQPHKVNKTLLQEYIKDFKKFKFLLAENVHRIEEEIHPEMEPSPKELLREDEKREQLNEHEIALKLQRKGLQDNVKQLLNWDSAPRKRQPKRVVKRTKPKPKLEKCKSAVSKEQSEKIVFNSSLLHQRLNELEREIEIFRKENKNLERLQRECNEERIKLSKDRKEFEREMQEEKERFEAKVTEEQKKLQKERTVFEKYCKQVKSQPSRQEREETAKLKKEIEKLTETLATKESRWGASQARLRNQIKGLEKENSQLKAEVERLKKLTVKKVSFESERSLNTKIIHAINSELGKLKPTVIKSTINHGGGGDRGARNQSLSARAERDLGEKPIRRIKSAPNVKKQMEVDFCLTEVSNEFDEKALGSVSTDSGIETNGSRYAPVQRVESIALKDSKMSRDESPEESSRRSPLIGHLGECLVGRKSSESAIESAVREAIFDDDMDPASRKIAEVKNRLERLNLFVNSEDGLDNRPVRMVRLPSIEKDIDEEERICSSEDEGEEDREKGNDLRTIHCPLKKSVSSKNEAYSSAYPGKNLLESKLDENGVWEKVFEDGSKEITYPNGNMKKVFPGSKIVRMNYYNGDIKETNVAEGSEKYYYAETKTWHTTYKDGLEVLEFPNGQTERRHADGSTEISFPNGCVRYCDPSGRDEWRFLDGTVIKTNESGHKILLMPNGQKEIHTKDYKRREYPDGTVKILHSDGTQETRYANGRVRLKDKDGNLVMDSGGIR